MSIVVPSIFSGIRRNSPEEIFETLLESRTIKIERIVSCGQASPKDFWYDQEENEWVMLVKGRARLLFEGEPDPMDLQAGNYLMIPAHKRHRVEWTDPLDETIWLAVYYRQ